MSWKEIIKKCLSVASAPIRRNANFFVFMYLLGTISSLVTIPKYGSLYDNLFLELLSTSTSCVPFLLSSPRRYASVYVSCYTLYYIAPQPQTPIAS